MEEKMCDDYCGDCVNQ